MLASVPSVCLWSVYVSVCTCMYACTVCMRASKGHVVRAVCFTSGAGALLRLLLSK